MACQEVCKQGRDDLNSEGKYTKPNPYIFLHSSQLQTSVKKMQALYIYLHCYIIPTLFA